MVEGGDADTTRIVSKGKDGEHYWAKTLYGFSKPPYQMSPKQPVLLSQTDAESSIRLLSPKSGKQ